MPHANFPQLDQFEFHHRLARTSGLSIVIFTSHGCSSCKAWKRLLADYRRQHLETHVFEVDAERDLALTREFGVFHLPALFLYLNGRYHCSLQCEARMQILEDTIERTIAGPAQEPP
jgi:thioredoxin 1